MYDYYDEPSYYEPSEADLILNEYLEKMRNVLLDSVKQEVENIKLENQRLKEENEKYKNRESEINKKEKDLEYEKQNLMCKVRKERLSELMKDFQIIMYKVRTTTEKLPKCNKCDEDRKIKFFSPSGKKMFEDCECNKGKKIYIPIEFICYEFKINRDNNKTFSAWYKENREKDYDWYGYQSSDYKEKVYEDGMDFEKIDWYNTFFKTKEDCQKYCNWLNKKENVDKVIYEGDYREKTN